MSLALWTGSAPNVLGSVTPRLATSPARDLDEPGATLGPLVTRFAAEIGMPLDPWEQWAVRHGLELRADGTLRFRRILLLVARQNGKTTLLVVLALWWLAVDLWGIPRATILGTSTKLDTAKEAWELAVGTARRSPALRDQVPRNGVRRTNGEQTLYLGPPGVDLLDLPRYKVSAATGEAGRGLTLHRAIADELREHTNYATWDALIPAMGAVDDAQLWAMSNAGSDLSVVLNDQRALALAEQNAGGDVCLLEWSSPDGADPLDPAALAAANPQAGRRMPWIPLLNDAARAVAAGGDQLAGFQTERMCQRVVRLDPAIDPKRWAACGTARTLDAATRLALVFDLSPDRLHATVYAAAADLPDAPMVVIDGVAAYGGIDAAGQLRAELPELVRLIRPRALGWFPSGPAATVAAELAGPKGRPRWLPRGTALTPIKADVPAVCMGLADLIDSSDLSHAADPLLDAQVAEAEKAWRGDQWVFARRGEGHVDAVYAAAGAAWLVRTLPASKGPQRIVRPRQPQSEPTVP